MKVSNKLVLLSQMGTLTRNDSCTHREFSFVLEEAFEALVIDFAYEPKHLADREKAIPLLEEMKVRYLLSEQEGLKKRFEESYPLNNLLTLSLDDPNGFRGAAHRQPSKQQLIVAENEATVGFFKGVMPKGQWRLVLTVHALVTEECRYQITIEGERK